VPTYQIAPPTSDGTDGYDTATTMRARYDDRAFPAITNFMKMSFDLSAYSGTITAARLRLNGQSYSATKGVAKTFNIFHAAGVSTLLATPTYAAAGMAWYTLSNFSVFTFAANVIHVTVNNPGTLKYRDFIAYTKEQATSPDNYDPMLEITIGGETVQVIMV